MGKLEQGFNGPISGKVGNIVGSSWNGIPYIKSRPKERETPPSENELKNQFIFGMTQRWLKPLTEFLRVGFNDYSRTVFGFNAAKSMLYERGLIRDGFNSTVDPSQVLISFGRLPLGEGFEMEFDRGSYELCIRWNPAKPKRQAGQCYAADNDQLMVAAYNVATGEVCGEVYGELRHMGTRKVALPSASPATFHVYAAFISPDRQNQSLSTYLGEVVI